MVIRGGSRIESVVVFSDEHLLRRAKGLLGCNAFHFETIATPRRGLAWEEAKENAEYCLKGNEAWRTLIRAYFDDIEKNHPEATMVARIYDPCNLMMGFYRLAKFNADDNRAGGGSRYYFHPNKNRKCKDSSLGFYGIWKHHPIKRSHANTGISEQLGWHPPKS